MSKPKSTQQWHQQHQSDPYVKQAQKDGYRSRAVYKLLEIQEKDKLIKPGMCVVDLGAAPGGWSQVAAKIVGKKGKVFAIDLLDMDPIEGVDFIQGDFTDEAVFQGLIDRVADADIDLVISDMAPNITGIESSDIPRALNLAECALDFAEKVLKPGGNLLIKLFHGAGFDEFRRNLAKKFEKVVIRKPKASKMRSKEAYLLAKGYNNR